MNDPRTCVYGHARKFGACGEKGTCTRPRGLPCLCGLVKARVPEPMPDKLNTRNAYTSRKVSGWTHRQVHTCLACGEEFQSEHRAAFHQCTGRLSRMPDPLPGFNCEGTVTGRISSHTPHFEELPRVAQRSLGLEDLDLSKIEERVVAHCCESAEFTQAAWDALGRCPWDNWKPGRDVA